MIADERIKRIHINQHVIRSNSENNEKNPVYTVKHSGSVYRAHDVQVEGSLEFVYRPDKPLSCGAKCWGQTRGRVVLKLHE